jgi:hypothetical protein
VLLGAAAVAAGLASISATAATGPSLRIGSNNELSVVGRGFRPGTVVRIQLVGPALDRRATVRTGPRGGFTLLFPGIARCAPSSVIARAANGVSVRVPPPFFLRDCPPPPPLPPGANPN